MKTIIALQAWNNFSEYLAGQVGELVKDKYELTITYNQDGEYLDGFDIIWCFFPHRMYETRHLLYKAVKTFWEPHEIGCDSAKINVACSLVTYARLIKKEKDAIYAPMGFNPKHFFPQDLPTGKVKVGWCGLTGNPRKRYKELKEIMDTMPSEVEFTPNIISHVNEYNKGKYKTVPAMNDYYRDIYIYVCPSASEGFGFPLLEATACGRPVITFDVGIASELVLDGAGIIIVNSFEEMKKEILKLSTNIDKIKELGEKSIKASRKWEWSNFRESWLKVFESV